MSATNSWSADDHQAIMLSLDTLAHYGLPVGNALARYAEIKEDAQRQPDADDLKWSLEQATIVAEHITLGNDRPTLDCHMVVGRAYSLTPGQRDYIRDHHNMTPAPLVEVIECAVYIGSQYIRRVTLRSVEHIDPRRRKVINKFTIDRWGHFMSEALANDKARAEAKERAFSERPVKATKGESTTESSRKTLVELMGEYGV